MCVCHCQNEAIEPKILHLVICLFFVCVTNRALIQSHFGHRKSTTIYPLQLIERFN